MTWNHEKTDLNGNELFVPGTLVQVKLKKHMLITSDKPTINPKCWIFPDDFIEKYGECPNVLILDLDPLEVYYQILLGEKTFWFPRKYVFIKNK